MPERMRRIRQRAHALFRQENDSTVVVLDSTFPVGSSAGRLVVTEEVRRTYYERAERELLKEGKIRPPLLNRKGSSATRLRTVGRHNFLNK